MRLQKAEVILETDKENMLVISRNHYKQTKFNLSFNQNCLQTMFRVDKMCGVTKTYCYFAFLNILISFAVCQILFYVLRRFKQVCDFCTTFSKMYFYCILPFFFTIYSIFKYTI